MWDSRRAAEPKMGRHRREQHGCAKALERLSEETGPWESIALCVCQGQSPVSAKAVPLPLAGAAPGAGECQT